MFLSREIKYNIKLMSESVCIGVVDNNILVRKIQKVYQKKRNVISITSDDAIRYMTEDTDDCDMLVIFPEGGSHLCHGR